MFFRRRANKTAIYCILCVVSHLTLAHPILNGRYIRFHLPHSPAPSNKNQSYYICESSSHACTRITVSAKCVCGFSVGRKKNRIEFSCFIASSLRSNRTANAPATEPSTRANICLWLSLSLFLFAQMRELHSVPMATGQDKLQSFFSVRFVVWFADGIMPRLNGFSPLDIKLSLLVCFAGEMFPEQIPFHTVRSSRHVSAHFSRATTTPRWCFSSLFFVLVLFSFLFLFCQRRTRNKWKSLWLFVVRGVRLMLMVHTHTHKSQSISEFGRLQIG